MHREAILCAILEERRDVYTNPNGAMSSSMTKPLSTIMVPPASNNPSKPLCLTFSLSEMEPGKSSDTKVITPDGDMPTKALYSR